MTIRLHLSVVMARCIIGLTMHVKLASVFLLLTSCGQEPVLPQISCQEMRVTHVYACDASWGCKSLCNVSVEDGTYRAACDPVIGELEQICGPALDYTP